MRLLTVSLAFVSVPVTLFLQLGCHVQLWYGSFCFTLLYFYFVMFGYHLLRFLFSNEKQKGSRSMGEGMRAGTGRRRQRENYNWDILYEKIIYLKNKNTMVRSNMEKKRFIWLTLHGHSLSKGSQARKLGTWNRNYEVAYWLNPRFMLASFFLDPRNT